MGKSPRFVYKFGPFSLDQEQRTLARDGKPVTLAPKLLDALLILVENGGRVLEKEELMQALWPESFVEEGNLTQSIFLLRKILDDPHNGSSFIQTIPKRGYRFVVPITQIEATSQPGGVSQSDYWKCNSPFRSLRVFEQEDAWLFFGRDAEIEELLVRLDRSPVLTIVGNSGCGKSSLVRAGLIPALQAGRFRAQGLAIRSWRIAMFRPSAAPFDYLAEVLPDQLAPHLSLTEKAAFIADCRAKLPAGGHALRNIIAALAGTARDKTEQTHILLVADQFEEIFTLTKDPEVRSRYIDALLNASGPDGSVVVHLILVLRADFYAHCLEHEELSRCLQANLYNVPPMTAGRLRESIEKRLRLAEAGAEAGLIDSVLEDVGNEPGNLALLEHALGQLWDKSAATGRTLTNQAYVEIGRLRGALGQHADETYESIGSENQKRLTQRIFLELIQLGEEGQDTSRRVARSELERLGGPEDAEAVLTRLVSSRLVSTGREGEETFVEVSHEALIKGWPALRDWLAQNREELTLERRLQRAAEEWEALDRDTGALLQGARLAQAKEWLAKHPETPASLRQFLQTSIENSSEIQERELAREKELHSQAEARAQAEKQLREQQEAAALQARRSASRLRWLSCGLAALLLVAVAAAWITHRQQLIAKSLALSAESASLWARDHGRALDLAIQGWHTSKTAETSFAVAKAFPEVLMRLSHDGPVIRSVFSCDGQRILSADQYGRLWDANNGRLLVTLKDKTDRPTDKVEDASFSPDCSRIVTAVSNQTARVWNAADGRLLFVLGVPKAVAERFDISVSGRAVFSRDGKYIVTTGWDNTAQLWNADDGHLVAVLREHTQNVTDAAFSPDSKQLVTAAWDGTARVWSRDGKPEATLHGHTALIEHVKFFPDGERIVTASWDGTARIWSRTDGRLLATLKHDARVSSADISPDGLLVVTVSDDHTARIWNSTDGRLLFVLQHDGPVHGAEFSHDGHYILTASYDHTARVWSTAHGRLLAVLEDHSDTVEDAGFSPDGRRIVTASDDHTLRVWNTSSALLLATLKAGHGYMTQAEFSYDGRRIVTVQDKTARVWRVPDGRPLIALQGKVVQAHFSPIGMQVVTAGADGNTARVWNGENGQLLTTLAGHTGAILEAQFSPDGQRVLTTSVDRTARLWNAAGGPALATLSGHTGSVWYGAFSPSGDCVVTTSDDTTARVWSSSDGHLVAVLRGHTAPVWRAAFSPDGQRVVTASFDHTARVWGSHDGRLLATLDHADLVDAAEFSPDGQEVVTSSWDKSARLWTSADGRQVAVLQGHTDKLIGASFSRDGRQIVTASADHTARVWSSATFALLATLTGHGEQVWQAAFSPDGQLIVTTSLDQTARVWRLVTLEDIDLLLAK